MFAIPTLPALVERARASFRANLPGSDAWLWPNNLNPTAKVIGGMLFELFGFADYVQRQKFALTADADNLDRHGEEIGLPRRPAAPARGVARFTATTALTVQAGAVLARFDGAEYRVLATAALPGPGTLDVDVIAVGDGKAGLALEGTALTARSGVAGTATIAVGPGGLVGGSEVEDDDSFRVRILFRKRNPPHGGAASDYVLWATEVPGVTRVFVERLHFGPGTLRVFPLLDDIRLNGIPTPADLEAVRGYLDTVQPAAALVTVAAPRVVTVNVTIAGLAPDTNETREAVLAELREAFRRLGRVAGSDVEHTGMPYLATPFGFSRSWLWQAVANATGEERHIITQPAADVALGPGDMAVLGTVTFV